jgi:2-dehydropantoate 2-reductase
MATTSGGMAGPRIAVLGTGANGAGVGADLIRAGHDVTFVEQWPENVAAMRRDGIRVEMPDRAEVTPVRAIHLCEMAEVHERFDVVFLVVKAYDTRWATELIKPYLAEDGVVVGLQNGMTLYDVESIVGPERSVAAVIEIAASMFDPGVVVRQTPPEGTWFALGSRVEGAEETVERVAQILRAAGEVQVVDDIASSKWMKLVLNATELATSAVVDLPLAEAFRLPRMTEVMRQAGLEALRTGVDRGHTLVPILGLHDAAEGGPEVYVDALIDAVMSHFTFSDTLTTILQDWRKGRRGEVGEINGLVAREQRRLGGHAPVNERIAELAIEIEAGRLRAGVANLERMVDALQPTSS